MADVPARVRGNYARPAVVAHEMRAGFADLGFLFLDELGKVRHDLPDGQHLSSEGYTGGAH